MCQKKGGGEEKLNILPTTPNNEFIKYFIQNNDKGETKAEITHTQIHST